MRRFLLDQVEHRLAEFWDQRLAWAGPMRIMAEPRSIPSCMVAARATWIALNHSPCLRSLIYQPMALMTVACPTTT